MQRVMSWDVYLPRPRYIYMYEQSNISNTICYKHNLVIQVHVEQILTITCAKRGCNHHPFSNSSQLTAILFEQICTS